MTTPESRNEEYPIPPHGASAKVSEKESKRVIYLLVAYGGVYGTHGKQGIFNCPCSNICS
jgi:hypothetical protein